ncbi:Dph6-related ATP pyrophosphatase [Enterovibrio coralii]|uniref:ATP-binding protein n=1 Tax=Enterovibrio coralii TaxID=294935 RepID=A0A135I4H0_9GAMM|nr:diphthine--ammonia ligase [Enterovibrio coralii]KXF80351.1 ATP-binding protein [Enterovibrio coralii]
MTILNTYFNWSSGKDSTMALYYALRDPSLKVTTLLTSANEAHQRVSMHGVHVSLLEKQADALGLPLKTVWLPETVTMEQYESIMSNAVAELKDMGCTHAIFGDIYLEDLRAKREAQLATVDVKALFPLWKKDTRALMQTLFELGIKAVVVAVDGSKLSKDFVGRELDQAFLDSLPEGVDPCGENGEFHTFVYDGPDFKQPVAFTKGEVVTKKYAGNQIPDHPGYHFQELIPA